MKVVVTYEGRIMFTGRENGNANFKFSLKLFMFIFFTNTLGKVINPFLPMLFTITTFLEISCCHDILVNRERMGVREKLGEQFFCNYLFRHQQQNAVTSIANLDRG